MSTTVATTPAAPVPAAGMTTEEKVQTLCDFFSTRLLLKRFRPGMRGEDCPERVFKCEAVFRGYAEQLVAATEAGGDIDAVEWAKRCTDFSHEWPDVAHWLSPRNLREFLSNNIGSTWHSVDDVDPVMERPPVSLKWYKNPSKCAPGQPFMCALCKVKCNSMWQYNAHTEGRQHQRLARAYARKNNGATLAPVPLSPDALTPSMAPCMTPNMTPNMTPAMPPVMTPSMTPASSPEGLTATLSPSSTHDICCDTQSELDTDFLSAMQPSPKHEFIGNHSFASSMACSVRTDTSVEDLAALRHALATEAETTALSELCTTLLQWSTREVVAAVLEAALNGSERGAALLSELAETDATVTREVQDALDEKNEQLQAAPREDEHAAVVREHQMKGLVRFVASLVQEGVVGAHTLVHCIKSICTTGVSGQVLIAAAAAVASVQTATSRSCYEAAASSIREAAAASWYPQRVSVAVEAL